MSGPPPPPPPPPPPGPPPPSFGGGSGGGGGPPAFLADIRKGAQLKKVPDSLKNDRSAALVSGGGVKSGGSSAMGGGGRPMGVSDGDIKSKLNFLFGGASMPAAPQPKPQLQHPKIPQTSPPPPPPSRPILQNESNPSSVFPAHTAQYAKPRRDAPRAPPQNSVNCVPRSFRTKPQAPAPPIDGAVENPYMNPINDMTSPPPPLPSQPPNGGAINKPAYNKTGVPPPLPARKTDSWEAQFQFPDESTFPPVPEPYRGNKTYVSYRGSVDDTY